jgi:hypothetical protein
MIISFNYSFRYGPNQAWNCSTTGLPTVATHFVNVPSKMLSEVFSSNGIVNDDSLMWNGISFDPALVRIT